MNAQAPRRGAELVAAGRRLGIGPQWLARLWSGGWHQVLDRIDAGLAAGSLEAKLPDGTTRLLGGRAEGFSADVAIHDWRALLRLATGGSVGWYEAWAAGEWSSPDPVGLFALFVANATALGDTARAKGPWRGAIRLFHWLRRNTRRGARRNIHAHYDLGNAFYAAWLDQSKSYSSAVFREQDHRDSERPEPGERLKRAQSRKILEIMNRLDLQSGQTVLEIGCGWGWLSLYMARVSGVRVKAISLSDEQLAWAKQQHLLLWPKRRVDYAKQDYRDAIGQFDAIVSVEMVEALGREHWGEFMDCLVRNLKSGGRAVLQYISLREDLFEAYAASADFIQTYVFPGGLLIKTSEFRALAESRGLVWSDQADFGEDYGETLRLWRATFDAAVDDARLPERFDKRFVDLWRYYLMYCEGGFRGGGIDVHQVTLKKA